MPSPLHCLRRCYAVPLEARISKPATHLYLPNQRVRQRVRSLTTSFPLAGKAFLCSRDRTVPVPILQIRGRCRVRRERAAVQDLPPTLSAKPTKGRASWSGEGCRQGCPARHLFLVVGVPTPGGIDRQERGPPRRGARPWWAAPHAWRWGEPMPVSSSR